MALSKKQRAATAEELRANFELSGISEDELQRALGIDGDRSDAAFEASGVDVVDVWLVRDYLERIIVERGGTPVPFTVLTPAARASAEKWSALYDLDEVLKDS
jgi:hypothetical protein